MEGQTRHAVIIGGGLGGLAAALRLSVRGWRVTVCEHGKTLGGKMNEWRSEGFRFDTGPSLITMPWIFEELFEDAGERLEDHLTLTPLSPLARYVFANGVQFDYSTNMPSCFQTLNSLEADGEGGFLEYMRLGARIYELSKETFLRRPIGAPPDAGAMRALRHVPLRNSWGNYQRVVERFFKSAELRQLFGRYPTYVGSSPYQCPATLSIIPYIEFAFGGWYVQGGLYRLVEALSAMLEARGVALRLESTVEAIEHDGERAAGVRLASGESIAADAVVMNGDAARLDALLSLDGAADLPAEDRSLSGVVFLIGVKRKLPEFHHHNIYFSADYEREFSELFGERRFPEDPTVYVNIPSRTEPSCAPDGCESLFVMANAPAADAPWGEAETAEVRRRVMTRLRASGFPDLDSEVAVELAITPQWMAQRYCMPGGAIYGANSHGWRRAFMRFPNKHRRIQGVYCATGSAHPGGGTPIVLQSAKIAVELMEQHESR
jgi:phytoene desaturase